MIRLFWLIALLSYCDVSAWAASKYEDSLKELAEGVAAEAIKLKKDRLAVLDFVDEKGAVTPIGRFLAEELATHLLVAGELKIVDHNLLLATMHKHALTALEASQAKAAKKVAKALRADLFVTGSYRELPEGMQVTTKLIGPYTVAPVGAARATVPKAGPLSALLKQAAQPPDPATQPKPIIPTIPVLRASKNEIYSINIIDITQRDGSIALDLVFENRSARPVKILCQLQDTYLQDEQGTQWMLDVAHQREGLCTRGMEILPRQQQRANLVFPMQDKSVQGTVSLHYREASPRQDRILTLDGLTVTVAPASEPEPTATQDPTPPAP
ncbi:MAG: hypothetical protein AMXMBFR67_03080 [Nitrospira sp.]